MKLTAFSRIWTKILSYKQMLPYCDVAHVTKIDFAYEADSFFPNLDEDPQWQITAESEEQTYFDLEYQFVKYERK